MQGLGFGAASLDYLRLGITQCTLGALGIWREYQEIVGLPLQSMGFRVWGHLGSTDPNRHAVCLEKAMKILAKTRVEVGNLPGSLYEGVLTKPDPAFSPKPYCSHGPRCE